MTAIGKYIGFLSGKLIGKRTGFINLIAAIPFLSDLVAYYNNISGVDYPDKIAGNDGEFMPAVFIGDGIGSFTITGLLTTDVITADSSDLPTCTVDGTLNIASGDIVYGVTITRASVTWAIYPFCQPSYDFLYDVHGGNHGTGVSTSYSNVDYSALGSTYHKTDGYSLWEHDMLDQIQVPFGTDGNGLVLTAGVDIPTGYTKTRDIIGGSNWNMADAMINFDPEGLTPVALAILDRSSVVYQTAVSRGSIWYNGANPYYYHITEITDPRIYFEYFNNGYKGKYFTNIQTEINGAHSDIVRLDNNVIYSTDKTDENENKILKWAGIDVFQVLDENGVFVIDENDYCVIDGSGLGNRRDGGVSSQSIPYQAQGDIIDISFEVTYSDGIFIADESIETFFFADNGRNMTAYYNGTTWAFLYSNFGILYNWYAVETSRIGSDSFTSSDDWRVSTNQDWLDLISYCEASSGSIDSSNLANHLKSRRQENSPLGSPWDTINDPKWITDITNYGLDTFKFGALGGGTRSGSSGVFQDHTLRTNRGTSDESGIYQVTKYIRYNQGTVDSFNGFKANGNNVNIVRDASVAEQLEVDGTVIDSYIQNNGYPLKCVKIGSQVWTSEVFETKWRDGTEINFSGANDGYFTSTEWPLLTAPGACHFNDSEVNSYFITFAALFDKYASNPVLSKGLTGSWESEGIRDPVLLTDSNGNEVMESGEYVMYYNGRLESSNITKVGRATSSDFINWDKEVTNPVFEDGTYAACASVIKRGTGDYIMYYGYDSGTKFNYATSADGITWVANTVGVPILNITSIPDGITMGLPAVTDIDGTQYMVFEVSSPGFAIYMAKSTDWVNWTLVGQVYTAIDGFFDKSNQANPSIYKVDTDYYMIIYNGNPGNDAWDLGMLHSNSIESGWEKMQNAPVLYRGDDGEFDDTRLEGGKVYRDHIQLSNFKMLYFGLPTTDSFADGAIGVATVKSGVTFPYQLV